MHGNEYYERIEQELYYIDDYICCYREILDG